MPCYPLHGICSGKPPVHARGSRAVPKLDPGIQFEITEAQARPKADKVSTPEGARSSPPSPDDGALGASAYEPSLQAQLPARGVKRQRNDLVSAEGTYDLQPVRKLMNGVTPQAISKRVREG